MASLSEPVGRHAFIWWARSWLPILISDTYRHLLAAPAEVAPLAKVGVEGSNPFARSRRITSQTFSAAIWACQKGQVPGGFARRAWGSQIRNDTEILSPNGVLSPELGELTDLLYKLFPALSIKAFTIHSGCKSRRPFRPGELNCAPGPGASADTADRRRATIPARRLN